MNRKSDLFAAVVLFRVDVEGSSAHPRYEAQIVVVAASDVRDAESRASDYGAREASSHTNAEGHRVDWHFDGVATVVAVPPSPLDFGEGVEVFSWPMESLDAVETTRRLVRGDM